jgi:hypothetical protein
VCVVGRRIEKKNIYMYIRKKKNRTNRQEDKKAVFGYTSVAPAYKNQKNETHVDRYKRKKNFCF